MQVMRGYNAVSWCIGSNKVAFGIADVLASEIAHRTIAFKDTCQNQVVLVMNR